MNEIKQILIEKALNFGQKHQSPQTGFFHYFHAPSSHSNERHDTIPLVENALFCLALFQSKNVDHVIEAKCLLENLLHFQLADGNFPLYIHDYPHSQNQFNMVSMTPPLYWILKSHARFLSKELKNTLQTALLKALAYFSKMNEEKPLSYHLQVKLAAYLKAIGREVGDVEMMQRGEELLNGLCYISPVWYLPEHLGELLMALQMAYEQPLKETPWLLFWEHLSGTWHEPTLSYAGPSFRTVHERETPQSHLYDLYLCAFSGKFSQRILKPHVRDLYGALIQPVQLPQMVYPKRISDKHPGWIVYQEDPFACSAILHETHLDPSLGTYTHPFRFIWGDAKQLHSIVVSNNNAKQFHCEIVERGADLFFTLDELSTRRQAEQEIALYFDNADSLTITSSKGTATTFQLGDTLAITDGRSRFTLQFAIESGEGSFFGHVFPGNRPSQLFKEFHAYDKEIYLRTINRSAPCRVKAELRWNLE